MRCFPGDPNDMIPSRHAVVFVLLVASIPLAKDALAQNEPLAQNSESFLVPPPEAVFNALAKVPGVDFGKLAALSARQPEPVQGRKKTAVAPTPAPAPSPAGKAMLLGARVADAYVAVQARDLAAYQRASDAIEKLAFEFTTDQTFRRKLTTAAKMAKEERWLDLKTVLETFRGDVLRELQLNRNQDAVALATFGGWLRGLQLSTLVLIQNYDPEYTRLLRQPALTGHLRRKLNALGPDTKGEAIVERILERMPELLKLIDAPGAQPLKLDEIKRLHEISMELMTVS